MRCGCNSDAFRIACTVLGGRPTFRASVRTVQRPCDSGCWQAKVCTFCQTEAACFGGRPERGASRNPSNEHRKRPPPFPHRDLREIQIRSDLLVRMARCCRQNNPALQHQRLRRGRRLHPTVQDCSGFWIEANGWGDSRHVPTYQKSPILQRTIWTMYYLETEQEKVHYFHETLDLPLAL